MSEEVNISAPQSIVDLAPQMEVRGKVKRLELFGAFVDIGIGQDALLHISQLGKPVRNVEDVVKVDDEITAYVLKVDRGAGRVALSLVKPAAMGWDDLKEGMLISGRVVRLENYGAFIDIGAEREAMVHVSELSSGYVNSPSDVVKIGDMVEGRIIKVNRKKRQIDMSLKAAETPVIEPESSEEEDKYVPTAMELALRSAMEGRGGGRSRDTKRDKRDRRDRFARDQEEIFSRTLRNHSK